MPPTAQLSKSRTTRLAAPALILSLTACTTGELTALHNEPLPETPFERALAKEYLDFAQSEADQYDWPDQQHFAAKGLAAARNARPAPEHLDDWRLPTHVRPALAQARRELVLVLEDGAPEQAPEAAAKAQAAFDCWVEQQEENWQTEHIARCRNDLHNALAALRPETAGPETAGPEAAKPPRKSGALSAPSSPRLQPVSFTNGAEGGPAVKQVAAAGGAPVAAIDHYIVYFAFDHAGISPRTGAVLDRVAAAMGERATSRILVHGHTDRKGGSAYNHRLALRRAEAVSRYLEAAGIARDRIALQAFGESRPRLETADGERRAENRRVEMYLQDPPARMSFRDIGTDRR